jgi:hypothetical protein
VGSDSETIDSYVTLNKLDNYDNNESDHVYSGEDYQNNSKLSPPGKKDSLRSQESEELDSIGMNLSEVCISYEVKFYKPFHMSLQSNFQRNSRNFSFKIHLSDYPKISIFSRFLQGNCCIPELYNFVRLIYASKYQKNLTSVGYVGTCSTFFYQSFMSNSFTILQHILKGGKF